MIKRTLQINSPASNTLDLLGGINDVLNILKQVQSGEISIPDLGKSLAAAYALTQPEKDERDTAVAAVDQARSDLVDMQKKISDLEAGISLAATQAAAANTLAKNAADQYVRDTTAALQPRIDALQSGEDELLAGQNQLKIDQQKLKDGQKSVTKDQIANAARADVLTKFADALRPFAPTIPILEPDSTGE